jgi:hypothetical protein
MERSEKEKHCYNKRERQVSDRSDSRGALRNQCDDAMMRREIGIVMNRAMQRSGTCEELQRDKKNQKDQSENATRTFASKSN